MSDEVNENNVAQNRKRFFKNFFQKMKRIKHLDIILTVLFIAIILLIYFSTFSNSSSIKNAESSKSEVSQSTKDNSTKDLLQEYTKEVEDKLTDVISNLKNAGNVSVAVKFAGDVEYVYAYSTKTETLENGTKIETKTPIFNSSDGGNSTPIILQTKMPPIESIIVVSSGAKSTEVKLDILRVVQLLYNLPSSKVEIFVGN